ncbi:MAG: hypothetical protein COA73_11575 [Candidatus Hydrogenedentota bacterium]|nr:MAG: hypothetical protein COA73_11575 [Candidatus Hydrogenedentota bacterium]
MAGNIKELVRDGLQQAFMAKMKDLYFGYYQCIVQADGDEAKIKESDERLKLGIKIAKQSFTDALRLSE